jgi:hypothetical protein
MLHIGSLEGVCYLEREDLTVLTINERRSGTTLENLPFKVFILPSHHLPQRIRVGVDTFVHLCAESMSNHKSSRWHYVEVAEKVEVDDVADLIAPLREAGNEVLLAGNCFTGDDIRRPWFISLAVYIKIPIRYC